MNEKYLVIIEMMTEQFCEGYLPVSFKSLENGFLQWEKMLDENEQLNHLIISKLETHWGDLVDNRNAYWDKENVTPEDKQYVLRRVKKDTIIHVKEKLYTTLLELLQQNTRDYFEHEKIMKSYFRSVFEKNEQQMINIEDLLRIRYSLESMLIQANAIAKVKIYLDTRNLLPDSLALVPFETKSNSIHPDQSPSEKYAGNEKSLEDKPTVHVFERRLRGGYVPFVKSIVPEYVVRQHGFQHGDLLHVERIYAPHRKFRYSFSLTQKVNQPQHERQQVNYCMIQQDKSMTYIGQYFDATFQSNLEHITLKDIRYNEIPYRFILKEEDIREFKIKAGEVVDIAFWRDNPSSVRVIWKHYHETLPPSIVHALDLIF